MANNFSVTFTGKDQVSPVADKVGNAIARVRKPVSDMRSAVSTFSKETGMDKLGRSIEKVGIFATESARRVASIAPPIAALTSVATIAGVAALAASWGKSAVQIRNTAYNIGMGTTQLQEYQGAAKLAGLSSEAMTSGLQSVGKAFEDASASRNPFLQGVLDSFGIGIHRLKNQSIDVGRAMHDIANAAATLPNAQARNEFLGFFGAQGLAPLLGQGAAELDRRIEQMRALNATMSPKQIAQGDRYNEAMVGLDFSVMKLTNSVGSSLAPAFTKVAEELIPIADRYGPRLAAWIDSINWDKAIADTERFVDSIGGVKTIAAAVAAITFAAPLAGAISLAGKLASIAGTAASLAANPVVAGITAAGLAGYEAGKWVRQYYDKYTRWATGGDRWSLNDYLTGTHRNELKDTEGYRQDELDSVKDRGGAKLAAGSDGRLKTLQRAQHQGIATATQPSPVARSVTAGDTQALFAGLESQYELPPGLLDSVYSAESGRGRVLLSPKGAMGPFQFMPGTARQYGLADPMDLEQSATAAARMYSDLLRANGGNVPRAVAAYNWGQGNLNRYGFSAQPAETRAYVDKVIGGLDSPGSARNDDVSGQGAPANYTGNMDRESAPRRVGNAEITVRFENAPPDMKASVDSSDGVKVSLKIAHSSLLGAQV